MADKIAVPVGLQDIVYAKLLSGDTITEAPVYETPKYLLPAITANVTPNVESNTLHGNDGPILTENALNDIEVEIGIANLTLEQRADLLGGTIDDDGLLWNNSDDQAPEVALGYRRSMSDGSFMYTWLLKGKFQIPTEEATTKQGEVEFQTPTITGTFLKRIYDNQWRVTADSNNPASAAKIATWFTKVPDSPKA